ncbi:MAG: dihydropteroate synthase, partial [Methanoregula sp.]|nr:dihydropteroate synthase [Methanoregula sp.]
MRILLPTGAATRELVKCAAKGFDADVVVTGEIASFLTPHALHQLIKKGTYDLAIVSGMCTASFEQVERETGVPVFRGPRHAADLALILPLLNSVTLSRTIPADDFIAAKKSDDAFKSIRELEQNAGFDFVIRDMKIGRRSRIKVLAEVMDAHCCDDIRRIVEHYFFLGADIVDLGFGFDATAKDVSRVFSLLEDIDRPLAVDSQDPDLIRAALSRADIVLSLQEN